MITFADFFIPLIYVYVHEIADLLQFVSYFDVV